MAANWFGRMFGTSKENGQENGHASGHPTANGRAVALPGRVMPIGNGASLSPLVDPDDVLTFEFGRARRYERALSIAVVSPVSWPDDDYGGRHADGLPPVLPLLTAAGLREVLRETDIMCYQPIDGRFVLGLTESKGTSARLALDRVQTLFKDRLRIDLAVGVAQFPSDGLTLEDLVAAARAQVGAIKAIEALPAGVPAVAAQEARAQWTQRPQRARARLRGLTSDAVGGK